MDCLFRRTVFYGVVEKIDNGLFKQWRIDRRLERLLAIQFYPYVFVRSLHLADFDRGFLKRFLIEPGARAISAFSVSCSMRDSVSKSSIMAFSRSV